MKKEAQFPFILTSIIIFKELFQKTWVNLFTVVCATFYTVEVLLICPTTVSSWTQKIERAHNVIRSLTLCFARMLHCRGLFAHLSHSIIASTGRNPAGSAGVSQQGGESRPWGMSWEGEPPRVADYISSQQCQLCENPLKFKCDAPLKVLGVCT